MVPEKLKKYFLFDVLLILILGIIMVYSSSYIYSKEVIGSSTHFLSKQLLYLLIGVGLAFVLSKTKMSFWYKNAFKLNYLTTSLLALTFTPLGTSIKGSIRWINLGLFSIQPGEFVKYTILFAAIYYFNNFNLFTSKDKFKYASGILFPLFLFILQPDFGSFTVSLVFIFFASFMSDFSKKALSIISVLGLMIVAAVMIAAPYRVQRLLTFLDPWSDPQNSGFQIIQSYLAFANGHIFGQGVGNSNEKLFYLPEAYNDFIFSVIGEEFGFLGVAITLLLFVYFSYIGFKLALYVKSSVNQQIITACVFAISFQAFLNMAVVLGLLPTKGLNLPFISYGGSSLISNLILIGFIFSCLVPKSQIVVESKEFDVKYEQAY